MGRCRVVAPETERLEISDGDWLLVKKELNAGEARRIYQRMLKDAHPGERVTINTDEVGVAQLLEWVVDWSLVDASGKILPISKEVFGMLDQDTFLEILNAVDAHEKRSDEARAMRKNGPVTESSSSPTLPSVA